MRYAKHPRVVNGATCFRGCILLLGAFCTFMQSAASLAGTETTGVLKLYRTVPNATAKTVSVVWGRHCWRVT